MRRVLYALLLLTGCSLNPQPLPPDERNNAGTSADAGGQYANETGAPPTEDAGVKGDGGNDSSLGFDANESDANDAGVDAPGDALDEAMPECGVD